MICIIEHFSDFFGGDQAFWWEHRALRVEHFSGETKP